MKLLSDLKNYFFVIENPEKERDRWIEKELLNCVDGGKILDAGCGAQPYKKFCNHLEYTAQDFGGYDGIGNGEGLHNGEKWGYGKLDYTGDIWSIDEKDKTFDVILCSEVMEHIPYPNETITEFSRLLKKGGKLILTAPYACLPHMQPYFYYSGFSENYYKFMCEKNGLEIIKLEQNSNVFGYVFQEFKRLHEVIEGQFFKIIFYMLFIFVGPLLKLLMKSCHKKTALHMGYKLIAEKK